MPSRRPPSQRDPQYAAHRLGTTVGQILPGARVKNATPVKAAPVSRVVPPAGGSGSVGGYFAADATNASVASAAAPDWSTATVYENTGTGISIVGSSLVLDAGFFLVTVSVEIAGGGDGAVRRCDLYDDGSVYASWLAIPPSLGNSARGCLSAVFHSAGSDTVRSQAQHDSTTALGIVWYVTVTRLG